MVSSKSSVLWEGLVVFRCVRQPVDVFWFGGTLTKGLVYVNMWCKQLLDQADASGIKVNIGNIIHSPTHVSASMVENT
jgi:hypothetical protein